MFKGAIIILKNFKNQNILYSSRYYKWLLIYDYCMSKYKSIQVSYSIQTKQIL